jgi:hypothetical protein
VKKDYKNSFSKCFEFIQIPSNWRAILHQSGGMGYMCNLLQRKYWRKMNFYFHFLDGASQGISLNSPAIKYKDILGERSEASSDSNGENFSLTRDVVEYHNVLLNVESGHIYTRIANRYFYIAESDYRLPLQALWSTPRPTPKTKFSNSFESIINLPSRSGNYYHFLVEDLPDLIRERERYPLAKVLVPKKIPKFAIESLEILNCTYEYTDHRFIHANSLAKRAKTPSGFLPSSEDIEIVRRQFGIVTEEIEIKKDVFVLRNHDNHFEREIADKFLEIGFEIIQSQNLSFAEQISFFRQARSIAGLHGAGLANMVFANPGCQIFEIGRRELGTLEWWRIANGWCYEPLARACKHRYSYVEF